MSWLNRFVNLFRGSRVDRDLEEELASHLEEAESQGRSPKEARRAFGGALQYRERSRDIRTLPWLESLVSDVIFGWRQLRRNRGASAAAILSLGLAIGATTAAFRLVDATLWRKLPVADPDRLVFAVTTNYSLEGREDYNDDFDYPSFRQYRQAASDRADVMLVGMSARVDTSFDGAETEKVYRQYFSGNVFGVLGLQPALGRLLTPNDDVTPGAHPVAVLSYDFWSRRFGRDPAVLGRAFRLGGRQYQIIGVAPKGFIGTLPGTITEIFIPSVMNVQALDSPGWSWFQMWLRPKTGYSAEQVREPLQAVFAQDHQERFRRFDADTAKPVIDAFLKQSIRLLPAGSGASQLQKSYRRPLLILGVLVALVLLIACANTANLMTAQAAARAREMALRVSIGAGQWRLIQMVLVESLLLAAIASGAGMLFSAWTAPLVVSMLAPPNEPVRLVLDADWRAAGFGIALTLAVALLFGLAPALRASSVKPIAALKGGDDPHTRRRFTLALVAGQMAFCVMVQFVAGLFMSTFDRLSHRPVGFSHDRVLFISMEDSRSQPPSVLAETQERIRRTPGVESVARANWPLLSGNGWTSTVRLGGKAPEARSPYFLGVSPDFLETMRIPLVAGRNFRPDDRQPVLKEGKSAVPGVGIVNETFARVYFKGENAIGRVVEMGTGQNVSVPLEIIGVMRDTVYRNLRESIRPTVFVPIADMRGTFLVRTAGDPMALAPILRQHVVQGGFRASDIDTQSAMVRRHMLRERLLAMLSLFFAAVALVLAGVGLYGVLNYAVVQRRREIGIRIALGARMPHVVQRVTSSLFVMVAVGAAAGLAAGAFCARFLESLLYEVKATDTGSLAAPLAALFAAAIVAAIPPAIRAASIDPAETLRGE